MQFSAYSFSIEVASSSFKFAGLLNPSNDAVFLIQMLILTISSRRLCMN